MSVRIAGLWAAGMGMAWAGTASRIPWVPKISHQPIPAVSAPFLWGSFGIDGPRLAAFKALTAHMHMDSTRHWEVRNGRLCISYDLMQDLAGGKLSPGEGHLGEKLAEALAGKGLALEAPASAHAQYLPGDEQVLAAPQWAIHNTGVTVQGLAAQAGIDVNIEKVWDKFSGSDSLVMADVDAGFDFNHPDLKGRNWINAAEAHGKPGVDDDGNGYVDDSIGWDFVDNDNYPLDVHGHGTITSSVMAAGFDNQIGIAGALAHARIMPIRVLDASGHGDEAVIAKGIQYAVRNGAKAINFSIGGSADNAAMKAAFQAAQTAGVPIIVAAGNDSIDLNLHPTYPASYPFNNIIVVASHGPGGLLSHFSNWGHTTVHLAAPGEFITTCSMPDPLYPWGSYFETDTIGWDTVGSWRLTKVAPLERAQSLEWVGGANASITTLDTLDLRGIKGGVLMFREDFKAANKYDALILEYNKVDSSNWSTLAVYGGQVSGSSYQSFALGDVDGSRFRLRFRTSLSNLFSPTGRSLKVDEILLKIPNQDPAAEHGYHHYDGTSVAAPYVTAYVGLLRLACDRMGVPFSRDRVLAGVDTMASLAGKVATGGRLDMYKGLQFYLENLPSLRVTDSTTLAWKAGNQVEYSLSVDPLGQAPYTYSVLGLPSGVGIDGAGKLIWTPTDAQAGSYVMRFVAEGPTTLRSLLTIKVDPADPNPVPIARFPAVAREWMLGGRAFRFPPGMESGRHLIEISAVDAAGRVTLLTRKWMEAPALGAAPSLASLTAGFHGWRVRADGIFLTAR
ncbi:MAG: S8 family serine peptidase [Fibrobacteres bacterium]|nr:S8 family serine peptidase [Fibrobacterota bacterium]